MSLTNISSYVQSQPLAESAKQETNNKKLFVTGITLLVISLIGLLVGLGLVICGLLQGTPFLIAGAAVVGVSVIGIGVAAVLLGISRHRSQKFLKDIPQNVEQEEPQEGERKELVTSKEEGLEKQIALLQKRIKDADRAHAQSSEGWRSASRSHARHLSQAQQEFEKLVRENHKLSCENETLVVTLFSLQREIADLKTKNDLLVKENSALKQENKTLEEDVEYHKKTVDAYVKEELQKAQIS